VASFAPGERFVDEPVLRELARLTIRPDRHAMVYLSDAVQQFNEQQRQDKIGREQPLLADDEVIAAIRAADLHEVKQELSDEEFDQFQAIAEMRLLPGCWALEKQTQLAAADGALWSVWTVGLTLNRVDGTEFSYTIRNRTLTYDPARIQREAVAQEAAPDWGPLGELVAEFNREERPAEHGQPPRTADEVIACLERFLRQDHPRKEQHFSMASLNTLITMDRERKVPPKAERDLLQLSSRNTSHLRYWSVVLKYFVGGRLFAIPIRHKYISSSPIERIPDDEIAWGPAVDDGLQVGVHVMPEKTSPVPGTRYTATFYFRNLTSSSTIAPVSPIAFQLDARSATGDEQDVTQTLNTFPAPTAETATMKVSERRERWGAIFILTTTNRDSFDTSTLSSSLPLDRASPIAAVHCNSMQPVRLRFRIRDCRVPMGHTHASESDLVTGAVSLVFGEAEAAPSSETHSATKPVEQQRLPDYVSKALHWLPTDTETLLVATDFSLTNDPRPPSDIVHIARMLAVGPLPAPWREFLSNKRVAWVVQGGRNFDELSAFGGVRREGASVIRLEHELSQEESQQLHNNLRDAADDVRSISENQVFVFPADRDQMAPSVKLKSWQGEFVVLLDNRTLIAASSDAYLEQILERVNSASDDRALPDHLPEWKHLNFSADAWLLRHLPAKNEQIEGIQPGRNRQFYGLVWMANISVEQPFRAVYLPMPEHHVDTVGDEMWAGPGGAATLEAHVFSRSVTRLPDGAMVLSLEENPPGTVMLYLHYSQGLWR